jgi:hypothetical protein
MPDSSMTPVALLRAHSRHAPWNARGSRPTSPRSWTRRVSVPRTRRRACAQRALGPVLRRERAARPPGGAGTAAHVQLPASAAAALHQDPPARGATLEGIKKEMKEVTGDALERRVAPRSRPRSGAAPTSRARQRRRALASWRASRSPTDRDPRPRRRPAARDEALVAMREAVRAALGRARYSVA